MQRTEWNTTVVRTGQLLTEFDDQASVTREINIDQLGLDDSWGNFQFTDKNTVILNSLGNSNGEDSGLYQCTIELAECIRLNTSMPAIRRHWFSTINSNNSDLIISHVSRAEVYTLDLKDPSTTVKATLIASNLKQPGVVRMDKEHLLLLETNRSQLLTLDPVSYTHLTLPTIYSV